MIWLLQKGGPQSSQRYNSTKITNPHLLLSCTISSSHASLLITQDRKLRLLFSLSTSPLSLHLNCKVSSLCFLLNPFATALVQIFISCHSDYWARMQQFHTVSEVFQAGPKLHLQLIPHCIHSQPNPLTISGYSRHWNLPFHPSVSRMLEKQPRLTLTTKQPNRANYFCARAGTPKIFRSLGLDSRHDLHSEAENAWLNWTETKDPGSRSAWLATYRKKDWQITQLSSVIVMANNHDRGPVFLKQLYFVVSLSSFNVFPGASFSLSMTFLAILK